MSTQDAELIDIEEIDQRPKINFCTPKLVILTIFASYFVAQNLYIYIKSPPKSVENFTVVQQDEWQQFWSLFDRFQGYLWVSIFGSLAFYFLRKYNDRYQQAQFMKQQEKRLLQQQKQRKLQSQRQQRIIRKLQEEQRLQNERQINMAKNNKEKYDKSDEKIMHQKQKQSSDKKND